MLYFFAEAYFLKENKWMNRQTTLVEPIVSSNGSDWACDYAMVYVNPQASAIQSDWWRLHFSIVSLNQFKIQYITCGSDWTGARIYKVIGIY